MSKNFENVTRSLHKAGADGDASKFRRKIVRLFNILARGEFKYESGKRLRALRKAHRPVRFYQNKINKLFPLR